MGEALIIYGTFTERRFVSHELMPDVEGPAELIIHPTRTGCEEQVSIFDLFGQAEQLRSGEEIDAQVREERDAWDD